MDSSYQYRPYVRYITHKCLSDAEPYPIVHEVVQRITTEDNGDLVIYYHRPDCEEVRKS